LEMQHDTSGNTCNSVKPCLRECHSLGGGGDGGGGGGGGGHSLVCGGGGGDGDTLGCGETLHSHHPRLTRQCSLQSPLDEMDDGEDSLRLVREEGLPSVVGRGEAKRRKETRKKRERVFSLPPVWQLVPVTCLYLLLLLLFHLISPIIPSFPSLPASPPTCGLYNQSITRHSSL